MSRPRTDMHKLQELIRLYRMGTGVRARCGQLRMNSRTERKYRKVLQEAELWDGDPNELPSFEAIRSAVLKAYPKAKSRDYSTTAHRWLEDVRDAVKSGVGPTALFDRLRLEKGEEFTTSLSSLKRAYRRIRREQGISPQDVVLRVETQPGEVAQVDFGHVGSLFDPTSGRERKAYVFVMTLGYSRHMFAKIVFDQSAPTWVALHIEAFKAFGGVPRVIVPDNLKAAVIQGAFGTSDAESIQLNRSYRELARHYGFKIDPTPVYSPEKKGKVESSVKYIKGNFFKARTLHDVVKANSSLASWVEIIAGTRPLRRYSNATPLERFEREKPCLLQLPVTGYKPIIWHKARVHNDSHVKFGEQFLSVPFRFIGEEVWLRATPDTVYIFHDDVRICEHERALNKRMLTKEEHLPEGRRDYRHRSPSFWLERAAQIGPMTLAYVTAFLDSDTERLRLSEVQALVVHLENYPPHRAEAAAQRAHFYANFSATAVKKILSDSLDLEPLPTAVVPTYGKLSTPRFARTIDELVYAFTMDEAHDCH